MNPTAPQFYTAAQLAKALGRKRQAIGRALRDTIADGELTAGGMAARAWSFAALPAHMQRQLETTADGNGFRNVEHLLSSPGPVPAPVAAIVPPAAPIARTEGLSLDDEVQFRPLAEFIALFKNPAAPSAQEKSVLWLRAFELYEDLVSEGHAPKKLKRRLLAYLERRAAFLVSTAATDLCACLYFSFHRKHTAWLAAERAPDALKDRRSEKSGNWRAPKLSSEDRDKIIGHAVLNCGGRVSQAWRELVESREISEDLAGHYLSNPSRKSHVPRAVRESVKYEVAMMDDIHHGPRQDKLGGAHLSRDWSTVAAGDWMQADDATLPVYYYAPDGNGWYSLMRGQTLLMIDLRSTRILGFVLISERNYTGAAIRTLTTKVCDRYGLPRKGFYYENGIWRSRLIKGSAEAEPMSWAETEGGLRDLGLRFVHARLPRAKPVEGVFGASQNLMEGVPGYIGRNEQTEKFERVQKIMREVASRKVRPEGHFLSEDEWTDALETLCAKYNAAIQNGKMTGGLSPDEAFNQYQRRNDPPVKFSAECRFLLANHRRPVRVTANGITLPASMGGGNYRNEETGKLRGQTVFAWIDPENPEIITVTDTKRQNPFCVARSQSVPAMDAPADIMSQEMGRIAAHQSYGKARYRVLKAKHVMPFRPMLADAETVELGARIGAQRSEIETAKREQSRQVSRVRRIAGTLGSAAPSKPRNVRLQAEANDLEAEANAEIAALKTKATNEK